VFSPDGQDAGRDGFVGGTSVWDVSDRALPRKLADLPRGADSCPTIVTQGGVHPYGHVLATGDQVGNVALERRGSVGARSRSANPLAGHAGAVDSVADQPGRAHAGTTGDTPA
jgi:hypothetical protein